MKDAALTGYSILVVEAEPFVARCLQMLLEGAGADVLCTPSVSEALRIIDRMALSAAVLDCSERAKGRRQITQRLGRRAIPFVLCKDAGQNEPWPDMPILTKPLTGGQLVETLLGLIEDERKKHANAMIGHPGHAQVRDAKDLAPAVRHSLRPGTHVKEVWHGKS